VTVVENNNQWPKQILQCNLAIKYLELGWIL